MKKREGVPLPLQTVKDHLFSDSIRFVSMDTDPLMIVTIQSSQGVTDLLRQVLEDSITY